MILSELIKDLNVLEMTADSGLEITGISYNSRMTKPGDLFVAVKGFASDGHRFIPKALASGAAAVLCEDIPEGEVPYVRIADCRLGLALVSRTYFDYPASKMKMIGITGTNGKTTSTYLIKHMLETVIGAKVGLVGTNGNMIGDEFLHSDRTTPESYDLNELFARMYEAGCTHVVMEVSSHAITLDRVGGIFYDVGVFTNLTQDHLDFHDGMEDYANTKAKLFSRCAFGAFNIDDEWSRVMRSGATCRPFTFSLEREADLKAENIRLGASSVEFTAVCGGEQEEIYLGIPGMFSVHNALGVISACLGLGLSLKQCADGLRTAKGVKGRAENVPTDGDYSIVIDYSHTPDSLQNILETMRPITKGKLVALFGCGGDRDRAKRPIMGEVADRLADFSIVTSDNPRTEDPMAIIEDILPGMSGGEEKRVVICDRVEAIHWAIDHAGAGDIIVLAGKGHEDYQEINHVKYHMDEREIVADYLKARKK